MFEWIAEQVQISKRAKLPEDRVIGFELSVFNCTGCELMTHNSRNGSPDICQSRNGYPGAIRPSERRPTPTPDIRIVRLAMAVDELVNSAILSRRERVGRYVGIQESF